VSPTASEQPSWNTGPRTGHWLGRLQWGAILTAFAVALAITLVVGALASWILFQVAPESSSAVDYESGPFIIAAYGAVALGFVIGGMVVRRMTYGDPLLHASMVALIGIAAVALVAVLDGAFGFPTAGSFFADDSLTRRASQSAFTSAPWWLLPLVMAPAAALGAMVMPPRGERLDEARDRPNASPGL
jgi:hypothetical protein